MKISRPAAFATGAVMALILGSGTAVAATGGKFILGKSNSATTTTKLTNSRGTALALTSKPGTAPLTVNSPTKVGNLNADKLDGYDSSQFALAAGNVKAYDVPGELYDLDEDLSPDYIGTTATCPAGSRRTGGGIEDWTESGVQIINAPYDGNSWTVLVKIDEAVTEDPTDVTLSIICFNPRGVPSGGYRTAGPVVSKVPSELLAKAASKVASHR